MRRLLRVTPEPSYAVLEAADGDEAWALLHARRPDLALLDVDMPGRGGLWLARAIRLDVTLDRTRVALLSGWASADDVRVGREAGADRYLTKPFSPGELLGVVSDLLGHAAPPTP